MPYIFRAQNDPPNLEESDTEELWQRECRQKIQAYRLVREQALEQQEQQRRNRKEMMRRQMNVYEKMKVGAGEELLSEEHLPSLVKHQILVSPSCLQAAALQGGVRFSEAVKKRSQVVATDKGIETGALEGVQNAEKKEEPPTPATVRQPKKRGKNKKK